ncbi:S-layer homology domain-containing protein [Cohnella nanjingensis]|nr:S-layer homology domain-containing protein [Cohnella nanjingensis]
MNKFAKTLLLMVALFPVVVLFTTQRSEAVQINRFGIIDPMTNADATYLVAGKTYNIYFDTDKAGTTSFENRKLEYSTDNGATWVTLYGDSGKRFWTPFINMPIDPRLVSAKFRLSSYFDPIIGSKSYSEKIIGPYKILQPASITDAIATPNEDGKVTLAWNDNSNMETNYIITRYGPDGTKTFYKNNTTDHIGPLSYVDDQTDPNKSSVYIYKLSMVIDRYGPDYGTEDVFLSVKTKVPPKIIDKITNIPIIQTNPIDSKVSKYLVDFNLYLGDLNKVAVSGVKLNANAITLNIGETQTLTADVIPSNAANREVTWSIQPEIAEVDSAGKVTGRSQGSAILKVKSVSGGFTDACVVTVIGTPEPSDKEPPSPMTPKFTDIAGNPASAEIEEAVALGVVFGYPDGTFRPDEKVTRAEFANMIIRGLKPADEGKPLPFTDKNEVGAWALPALQQAYKLDIIHGYSDKSIRPNHNITHAEMIVMVISASKLPLNDKPTSLTDDGDIPKWAKPSVSKAEETGIIIVGGLPDGKFMPQAITTRAEAASAIVRMLKMI